jgi:hypothetical protein
MLLKRKIVSASRPTVKEFFASFPKDATFEDIECKLRLLLSDEQKWRVIAKVVQSSLAALAVYWAYRSGGIILRAQHVGGGKIPSDQWSLQKGLPWVCLSWSALPPLWFMFEFWCFFPKLGKSMEEFKYGQELAKNFWASIAVVLIGVLLESGGLRKTPSFRQFTKLFPLGRAVSVRLRPH